MIFETLPPFIEHELYDDDTYELTKHRFYLTILADDDGKFNVGYQTHTMEEWAIPSLVTMHSDNLHEAGMRLRAKVERFKRLSNS